jgi:hypothetical protein
MNPDRIFRTFGQVTGQQERSIGGTWFGLFSTLTSANRPLSSLKEEGMKKLFGVVLIAGMVIVPLSPGVAFADPSSRPPVGPS